MEYKGLWGNELDPYLEDREGALFVLKKIAKDAAIWIVDNDLEEGGDLGAIENMSDDDAYDDFIHYLENMNIEYNDSWAYILNDSEELKEFYLEERMERIFKLQWEMGYLAGKWPLKKMVYTVDFYYNCCYHYTVEAKDKEEAIEKATELDRRLTKKQWYYNLDSQLVFTDVNEKEIWR